ncbi:NADH oxidoreductase [Mixta tenebrionis]|uniref:NADH oxidoreductase n=1 Tax=Mixta tenebrionis TaxID=2562439 RepID=A0A506VH71_9GAMM|nr:NADH oxidoreductase [Mixta tenebrionis]TPW44589.1 NADH oxidoreductase [Mixta tenebrionis]
MNITTLCPWRMQVHHIIQETPDVWTLALIDHDFYRWQAGQFALVRIGNSEEVRAYTLSSTPGQSRFITLTIRHIEQGKGSSWLTQQVKPGDFVWLSDPQGDFSCEQHPAAHYLLLAAGCGITPVMSMARWLHRNRPETDVQLIYSVRSPRDVIFAAELQQLSSWLKLTIIAEQQPEAHMLVGRLTRDILARQVPDMARRTVMMCGPQPYMDQAESDVRAMGALKVLREQFTAAAPAEESDSGVRYRLSSASRPLQGAEFPAGWSLLAAMEQHKVPVEAVCRAGVCGCCKTRVARGEYQTSSTVGLTEAEIAAGYVLACSCQPAGDIELA